MLNLDKETYAGRIAYKQNIGKKVAGTYFVLDCDNIYRDQKGNFHTHTNMIQLTAWQFNSQKLNNYGVGDNVYVESHTATQSYKGKDNKIHYSNRHVVDKINLIQHSRKNQAKVNASNSQNAPVHPSNSSKPQQSNSASTNNPSNPFIQSNSNSANSNSASNASNSSSDLNSESDSGSDDDLPF